MHSKWDRIISALVTWIKNISRVSEAKRGRYELIQVTCLIFSRWQLSNGGFSHAKSCWLRIIMIKTKISHITQRQRDQYVLSRRRFCSTCDHGKFTWLARAADLDWCRFKQTVCVDLCAPFAHVGSITERYSYVSKNVKLQQADFLINISSLDILKTLLHKCRVSPSEGITVLNFLSADANMCLHKVRMRITAVRHSFHHPWRMRTCCKNTSGTLSTKKLTNWV